MRKLTARQRAALSWLSEKPWIASWWGGKPHTGWPKQFAAQTCRSLREAGLITISQGRAWSEQEVSITKAGREALKQTVV